MAVGASPARESSAAQPADPEVDGVAVLTFALSRRRPLLRRLRAQPPWAVSPVVWTTQKVAPSGSVSPAIRP